MEPGKKRGVKRIALFLCVLALFLGVGGIWIAGNNRTTFREASYIGTDTMGHIWMLTVKENGDFYLYDLLSSVLAVKDPSEHYEWKKDRLTLDYGDGTKLCFEMDGENLVFCKERSSDLDAGVFTGRNLSQIGDGTVFKLVE